MKKAAKILAWFAAGIGVLIVALVLTLGGIGYWAFQNPLPAYKWVERHFLPADLNVTWKKIDVSANRLEGLDFVFDLQLEGLHLTKSSPSVDLPIEHISLRASIFPLEKNAQIHVLEVVAPNAISYKAAIDSAPGSAKNPFEYIQMAAQTIKMIQDRLPIETLNVQAEEINLQQSQGETITSRLMARRDPSQPFAFEIKSQVPGAQHFELAAEGQILVDSFETNEPFLKANLSFTNESLRTKQNLTMTFSNRNDADASAVLKTQGAVHYNKGKLALLASPQIEAHLSSNEARILLSADVRGIPGPIKTIDHVKLTMRLPMDEGKTWSPLPTHFSVQAPLNIWFLDKRRRSELEKSCACKIPKQVNTKVDGQVWFQALFSDATEKQTILDASLSIEHVRNRVFSADLAADLKVEQFRNGLNREFIFLPSLKCKAVIQSFRHFRTLLDGYGVLIPAPFDILDGTVVFNTTGPVETNEHGSQFPLALTTDLHSKNQSVKVSTSASVQVDSKFTTAHFDVAAKIADLALDLPPLDPLGGLPRVAADSRFLKAPVEPKIGPPKFKMSFNFQVETKKDGAIRLSSKYFKPWLPLTLNIQSSGASDRSGFIRSEPFDVTYLRRTVRVERMQIGLDNEAKGAFPLTGRISVKQTQYTVFIDVAGTTKSPAITMSSEPYLPKNQIVSVLLYDRTTDQLISSDAETAGGVQAAIADRAIGIFGLWAFATTPIKSFSYNPVTKVYSAVVAISDDLTAGVGTNWEAAAHLELRKQVSRRWSLTAAWVPATQEETESSSLVLQWEKRF